jgi:integrase
MEKPGRYYYGPVNGLSRTQERKRRRRKFPNVFFKKELTGVFEAIDNPRTLMGAFLSFMCALRISEVCKLQWVDIDLQEARLKVVDGKNHKDGFIPISPVALPILQKWREMNPGEKYVLPSDKYDTGFYQTNSLLKDYKKALAKAGLSIPTERNAKGCQMHQYKFHTLRHSRCTHLLSNGVPLEKVQKFMRHDKIETTMTYTWILDTELNSMVQKVDTGFDELAPAAVPLVADRPAVNPIVIAQKRLACGEISIREYQKIARALTT